MDWLIPIIFFVFGSLVGSFLNVVILRLPEEKTLLGRSMCTHCNHTLSFLDLFPVFSYLVLGGKCRYCKNTISARYFLIELLTAFLFSLIAVYILPHDITTSITAIKFIIAISALVVIFFVDLEHYIILDSVLLVAGIGVLVANFILSIFLGESIFSFSSVFTSSIFAGLLAFLSFFFIWFVSSGEWMGFGDVKLVFLLGLIVGFPKILLLLMLAFCLGAIVSIPLMLFFKRNLKSAIPFGTFLSAATIITMFFGHSIINWYLSLIGL